MYRFSWMAARSFVGAVAGLMFQAQIAAATTYYVRASGSDDNDGLTPETAFAGIRHAGRLLLRPGDRVVVGPGVYVEGNIEPYGSGTRGSPIEFDADPSGKRTGDAPGPVTIRPPNAEDSTTGFIVYGKHGIHIRGFTIEGAADAGIQVRENYSTLVDSTRVTIENNTIVDSIYRGIDVTAAGDVEIAGNTLAGNGLTGISLFSGQSSTPVRPWVHDNLCERNGVGIAAEGIAGGTIEDNTIRFGQRGLGIASGSQLTIRRNRIGGTDVPAVIDVVDLDFSENIFEGASAAAQIATGGTSALRRNRAESNAALFGRGSLALIENELPRLIVEGRPALELRRNEGEIISGTAGSITATDNRWRFGAELLGTEEVRIERNMFGGVLELSGSDVHLEGNEATATRVTAPAANIVDNRLDSLLVIRGAVSGTSGGYTATDNDVLGNLVLGSRRTTASGSVATAERNDVGGSLSLTAGEGALLRDNTAGGIFCDLLDGESEVTIVDNVARGYAYSGIIVRGARGGVVEGNESSGNTGSGIAVRRVSNLRLIDNVAVGNGRGGISVDIGSAIVGDCNNDNEVTVDEIIRSVDLVLGNRRLGDCMAIDANGDEEATVDEVISAVDAALGGSGSHELPAEGEVFIAGNMVEDNALYGIDMFTAGPVTVGANRVLRNGGIGVAARLSGPGQSVAVRGNLIGANAGEGVFLGGTAAAEVRDNFIFSNGDGGVLLRNARGVSVANNLIYDNGNDGIAVGVGTPLPSPDALLMNNTLHANRGWGVTIGTADAPSTGTTLANNIIDGNLRGGVAAQAMSLPGLRIDFNLNNDDYGHELEPSVTDFEADPRFVTPSGADGILGGGGFADDNFHLQPDSAAIDAGSGTAARLGISGSAVSGTEGDEGIVDLGFHYPSAN